MIRSREQFCSFNVVRLSECGNEKSVVVFRGNGDIIFVEQGLGVVM